jgi:hypothetical protein
MQFLWSIQAELGVFYERERCFDEFSSLLSKFQVINRSDLDGSGVSNFFRNELPKTGSMVRYHTCLRYCVFAV